MIQISAPTGLSSTHFYIYQHKIPMSWYLLSLVLFAQLPLLGNAQTCYWPDKSVAQDITPCNSAANNSQCCGPYALCLDNGYAEDDLKILSRHYRRFSYCFNQGNEYGNRISRSECTDRTWDSDACPQKCQTSEFQPLLRVWDLLT
jgi:hypothetical protein